MRVTFAWIFFLLVGYVSCRWWGRLIPPFLKRNQRGNRAIKFTETAGAGLSNLGNTCYMNSVLQSLFYSLSYREKVMGSSFAEESVGEKMSWLFEEMEGSGNVDTSQVARALDLNPGTQEDAQEFMLRLLDEVDKSYDTESQTEDSEPVSNAFQGYTDQTIQCINIDYSKTRKQRFLDLTVDILGHEKLSAALMDMFSKPDYLIGENQYKIPKNAVVVGSSDSFQDAEKRLKITKLPDMLCLTLKRFSFDPRTSSMRKIGDMLEFPLKLDMSSFLSDETSSTKDTKIVQDCNSIENSSDKNSRNRNRTEYQLSSVIVHEGSASFGHYICYARPDPFNKPETWLKLNDQSVSDATFKEVFQSAIGSRKSEKFSKNAYMLFYTRK